ncbi:MAG: hypothetical protein EBT22_09215 [Chloroflexi bacterium]|nr:hypothetical protein [Chloroflexota bacterium]
MASHFPRTRASLRLCRGSCCEIAERRRGYATTSRHVPDRSRPARIPVRRRRHPPRRRVPRNGASPRRDEHPAGNWRRVRGAIHHDDRHCHAGSDGLTDAVTDGRYVTFRDRHQHGNGRPLRLAGAFVSIAQGVAYTCGLTSTDIAYCWGYNASGQLGDGSNTDRLTPTLVAVSGGLTFTTIAAGSAHTCGLTSTRTAYCWGNGPFGQLGDGSNSNRLTPTLVAVSGGLTFTTIAAGNAHTCGLTSTGIAYCWGRGNVGQLGDGTTTDHNVPTAVSGGHTFSTITAGYAHTCGTARTPTDLRPRLSPSLAA